MPKKEIRVIGIDDAPFNKFKKGKVRVIGTVFRGGTLLEGVLSTKVSIDGNNATEKIADMINKSKFKLQLQCIFLDGIAVGGFNIIDVKELNKKTKLPVIVIIRKRPDINNIKKILEKLNKKSKIKLLEKAGPITPIGNIYIQLTGLSIGKAKEILKIACTRSLIPEAVRISHLIASGITYGESRGKA
ncbi:MAG: DUF99 family protein [Candidatus Woesearchaeota archaeon]|jgi:hypothetical protein|nr:hypothetical protein [archaeon]MDP6548414.1 DUF99 family protein [Candidatus Woesearchaeota archaeon]MDP7263134.1 DUF99 family protein [Candidatus Woesearchaeota archaeon]MDP7622553.1 DUF99 family protein [Candidatus Woesearchaeota archaeon]HJN56690.1 DUF99 family protein [Candidatus Woesearchaeota archaeon]|tara:strand:- start:4449 stop:5012 length:564 start_codon:yes stop_codon:yes gene_type:complete